MKTLFFILLSIFLINSGFNLPRKNYTNNKATPLLQTDSVKNKISLLKKISEALKFRKNAHEREKIRVIHIIDDYIKKAELTHTDPELAINSINIRLSALQEIITKIQSDIEEEKKPSLSPNKTKVTPDTTTSNHQQDLNPTNNEKYIADLIKEILTDSKPPADAISLPKQERLALIKKLILQPITLKDTLNHKYERERLVKLKHAGEVWGFYPYTNREINLNYRLFNHLVINAYELNGQTGKSTKDLDLKNFEVVRRARLMNNKLIMGISADDANTNQFLQSKFAQTQFISEIITTLAENNMDGLNIQFGGLNTKLSKNMLSFINTLSNACRNNKKKLILSITIPDFDINRGYLLTELAPLTDRFLIDFSEQDSHKHPGPLAPLKQQSDYSIETCVSRYLNSFELAPSQLIILLPYYGIKRDIDLNGNARNPVLLSYNKIRASYQYLPVNYDEQTASATIEITDTNDVVIEKIWFDNEHTLSKKYDYIIKGGLRGVAIRDITADIGYGELSDELAYKFLLPDTVLIKQTELEIGNQKSGWAYIVRNLKIYYLILGNPCSSNQDCLDRTLLTYINIIFTIICIGLGIFCFSRTRSNGDEWAYKKTIFIITSVMIFILITCIFAWLYLGNTLFLFGRGNDCSGTPFIILYLIILSGITIGILLMRILLFPIVRQEDTP